MNKKILIAYFSATGTTAKAADAIARMTGGDLFRITPAKPYTAQDLDWHNARSRSSVEMNDATVRPALRETLPQIGSYDVVFLGYPIWWDLAPRTIETFIEQHPQLAGKTVIPFATSGGSGIAGSVAALRRDYPALLWLSGRLLNRTDERTVDAWLTQLGLH